MASPKRSISGKQEGKSQINQQTQQALEAQEKLDNLIKGAIRNVAATPEGQVFLNFLMEKCGYHNVGSMQDAKTGEILVNNLIHNEALRSLWALFRIQIPQNYLKEIEYMNLRQKAKEMIAEQKGE